MYIPLMLLKKVSERKRVRFLNKLELESDLVRIGLENVLLFNYFPEKFWDSVSKDVSGFFKFGIQLIIPTSRWFYKLIKNSEKSGFKLKYVETDDLDEGAQLEYLNGEMTQKDYLEILKSINADIKMITLEKEYNTIQVFNNGTIDVIPLGAKSEDFNVIRDLLMVMKEITTDEKSI